MRGPSTDNVRTEFESLIAEQSTRAGFLGQKPVTALFHETVAFRIVSRATEFGVF